MSGQFHVSDDTELSIQLHELFVVQGVEEVEIQDPNSGEAQLITKRIYDDMVWLEKHPIGPERDAAAAELRAKYQSELADLFKTAPVREVDVSSDDVKFGEFTDGTVADLSRMQMMKPDEYPAGIEPEEGEVCAFVDHTLRQAPYRIRPVQVSE